MPSLYPFTLFASSPNVLQFLLLQAERGGGEGEDRRVEKERRRGKRKGEGGEKEEQAGAVDSPCKDSISKQGEAVKGVMSRTPYLELKDRTQHNVGASARVSHRYITSTTRIISLDNELTL